jgi:hypothetical protein
LFPRLEIRQTFAAIGIQTEPGFFQIRQHRPMVNPKTEPSRLEIHRDPARLEIDADKAWDALAQGPHLATMLRIYAQGREAILEQIAEIVQKGDRMAAIHIPQDPVGEMATEWHRPIRIADAVAGPANYDNVDIRFIPDQLSFSYQPAQVTFDPLTAKPEIQYHPGKVNIYLRQKNHLEIRVVGLDARV